MLITYKKDKIILLTTHYMDEADILGDRIGIMTQGKMTCLGSSMFLKSRFGFGYLMTIIKSNPKPNEYIMKYLKQELGPDVVKLTEIQGEMTVQIPREYTDLFKDFFTNFDEDLDVLDIQSYGMSVTTLEQVFLEIGHDPNPRPKFNIRPSDSFDRQESPDKGGMNMIVPPHTPARDGFETLDDRDDRVNDSNRGLLGEKTGDKTDSALMSSAFPAIN